MNLLSTTITTAAIAGASVFTATPAFLTSSSTVQTDQATKSAKIETVSKETDAPQPPQPKVVTVQPGDYLTKIADENQTTSLRLFYANTDIANPDLIYPNQQLRVPTADENLTPRDVPVNQQIATPTAEDTAQAAAPRAAVAAPAIAGGSVWDNLAACESGGNWAINTGNGFYGGLQFTIGSWQAVGGSGLPSQASREEQIMRGQMLQARGGWGNWPACAAKLGLL